MRRISAFFLTLLLTTSIGIARADPPGRVARLNYASGAVSFAPADAPESWTHAVLNRPLTSGDRLWTDRTGRAELHVGSLAIRLAALTSLDVLHLDDDTLQLRLAQGAVNVRVRDLAAGETIEIATATGAVLLRQPGSYSVSSEPQSDLSRVLVYFGQAQVVTPTQTVTVPSSQSAMISDRAGIAFEVVTQASADEFERWSAERDRREDRVTSTRYVSRDMTGYEDLDQHGSWSTLPEYGPVWIPARVAPGWAPYRHGHWSWISPWGWTWIDDAPWGFAPSHYGRWVWVHNYWAWAPGRLARRPVYAPALVGFVGGSNFSVSLGSGPAVGWFPLGWREPYRPWYRASPTHVHRVNVTHVTNVTNIHNSTSVHRYVNRNRPEAVTVVPQQAFISARPVAQSSINVSQAELARAEVVRDRQPAEPVRASFAADRIGARPPAQAPARDPVIVTKPAGPSAREPQAVRDRASFQRTDVEPRARAIEREREATRGTPPAVPPAVAPAAAPAAPMAVPVTPPAIPVAPAAVPVTPAVVPAAPAAVWRAPTAVREAPGVSAPQAAPLLSGTPTVITAPPPVAAPRAPEAAAAARGTIPLGGPESDRRSARREAGHRDEGPKDTSVERHPRAQEIPTAREALRSSQNSDARGEAGREREGPRARPSPAAGISTAGVAPPSATQPQVPRREERLREGPAGAPPVREGPRQRAGRDG